MHWLTLTRRTVVWETDSKGGHAFPARFATVPPGLGTRYVPGASVNQWVQSDTGPALHMFEAAAARGLTTIGLFTINDNVSSWWWPYLDAWIGSGGSPGHGAARAAGDRGDAGLSERGYKETPEQLTGSETGATLRVGSDSTFSAARPLSKARYGWFFEEFMLGGEGLLHAELLMNRDMETQGRGPKPTDDSEMTSPLRSRTGGPVPAADPTDYSPWEVAQTGHCTVATDRSTHPFAANPTTLRASGQCQLTNPGFWGVRVRAGHSYNLTLWVRAQAGLTLSPSLRSTNAASSGLTDPVAVNVPGRNVWAMHSVQLHAHTDSVDAEAYFSLSFDSKEAMWLDSISLMPADAVAGAFRPDIVDAVRAYHPGFIRFPGGNFIEGTDDATAWRWKRGIGLPANRSGHYNSAWGYWVTDALGIHEYLELCEALDAIPSFSVYTGYHLGGTTEALGSPVMDSIVQDAVDALTYANGDAQTTYWGRERAKAGHPAPFNLNRIEIGNEELHLDWYTAHFEAIVKAVQAAHPGVEIIGSGPWAWGKGWPAKDGSPSELPNIPANEYSNACVVEGGGKSVCTLWDMHFYRSPDAMAALADAWDSYDRKLPPV